MLNDTVNRLKTMVFSFTPLSALLPSGETSVQENPILTQTIQLWTPTYIQMHLHFAHKCNFKEAMFICMCCKERDTKQIFGCL